ncbi:collagen-binding domain-containing protein [Limobrevibacterium gyesilva]|uniref:Choice-of-anchor A family protein n=1 Tax=Limobrevibacterium gyesilva TaxID=2991712 RepID=A0AA41YH76_9PROT|nr:collagen-binding domain-containing protein [Limobrevibacterium gyesilva]MCW3473159.1 choice-of-anchor A family protein [Limobrevibacterium gyesilva]
MRARLPAPDRPNRSPRHMALRGLAVAGICLGVSTQTALANPTNGDLLTGFNLITNGNFTTTSESEGPLLIGGNMSGSGTVMNKGLPQPSSLSGYGSINVYGNTSGASYNANNLTVDVRTGNQGAGFSGAASVNYGYAFPYAFSSICAQVTQLSSGLASLATTAGSSLSGGTFTAGSATVNGVSNVAVLNITGSQLLSVGSAPTVNLGSAQLLIINVDTAGIGGSYTAGSGTNFNGQGYAGSVLWNFYNAASLSFGVEFGGSVIAPNANVSNNAPIDGTLFANSFTGNGELHYRPLGATGRSAPPAQAS